MERHDDSNQVFVAKPADSDTDLGNSTHASQFRLVCVGFGERTNVNGRMARTPFLLHRQ
jgi:hypothetical protein